MSAVEPNHGPEIGRASAATERAPAFRRGSWLMQESSHINQVGHLRVNLATVFLENGRGCAGLWIPPFLLVCWDLF